LISCLCPSYGPMTVHINCFLGVERVHALNMVLSCSVRNHHWERHWNACCCSNFEAHIGSDEHVLCTNFAKNQSFFECMISFVIVSYILFTTSTLTLIHDCFDFLHCSTNSFESLWVRARRWGYLTLWRILAICQSLKTHM
jgi:hypothetical protein